MPHFRAGKKVQMFEPLLQISPFKLRCHVYFNVCTCTLVQSKCVVNNVGEFQKSRGCVVGCFCLISQSSNAKSK